MNDKSICIELNKILEVSETKPSLGQDYNKFCVEKVVAVKLLVMTLKSKIESTNPDLVLEPNISNKVSGRVRVLNPVRAKMSIKTYLELRTKSLIPDHNYLLDIEQIIYLTLKIYVRASYVNKKLDIVPINSKINLIKLESELVKIRSMKFFNSLGLFL